MTLPDLIRAALAEDLPGSDLTADLTVPETARSRARLVAKSDLVFCGAAVVRETLRQVDPTLQVEELAADGTFCSAGITIGVLSGSSRGLLAAERTFLNICQYLSGVATAARAAVEAVGDYPVRLVDTRKTLPGLRNLTKAAVRAGGAWNHRSSLSEHVLIKENHLAAAGSIPLALQLARKGAPHLCRIEIEVQTEAEAMAAIAGGADVLLLDNFSPAALTDLVPRLREAATAAGRKDILLEASGGVRPETLCAFAATGVDLISLGYLTHSVRAADISLLFDLSENL